MALSGGLTFATFTHSKNGMAVALSDSVAAVVRHHGGRHGLGKALYLFSDGEQSAALDDSHSGIESLLLNLDTGKSGETPY